MAPLGLPSGSPRSSCDPAQGTREEAARSMRHANSPRHLRPLFSSRRFRHTAVSPPPCTPPALCLPARPAGDDRRANRNGRDSLTFANSAWFAPFASSRKGHSLPGHRANIRGPKPQYPGHLAVTSSLRSGTASRPRTSGRPVPPPRPTPRAAAARSSASFPSAHRWVTASAGSGSTSTQPRSRSIDPHAVGGVDLVVAGGLHDRAHDAALGRPRRRDGPLEQMRRRGSWRRSGSASAWSARPGRAAGRRPRCRRRSWRIRAPRNRRGRRPRR